MTRMYRHQIESTRRRMNDVYAAPDAETRLRRAADTAAAAHWTEVTVSVVDVWALLQAAHRYQEAFEELSAEAADFSDEYHSLTQRMMQSAQREDALRAKLRAIKNDSNS